MVTNVTRITLDPTVTTEGHLVSLGKNRNRFCFIIPADAIPHLGKQTLYEITFKPIGTLHGTRLKGDTQHG